MFAQLSDISSSAMTSLTSRTSGLLFDPWIAPSEVIDVHHSSLIRQTILSSHLTRTSSRSRVIPPFWCWQKGGDILEFWRPREILGYLFMFIFLCSFNMFQKQWTMACITLIWLSFLMLGYDFVLIYDKSYFYFSFCKASYVVTSYITFTCLGYAYMFLVVCGVDGWIPIYAYLSLIHIWRCRRRG